MPSTRNPSPEDRIVVGGPNWTRSMCHRGPASEGDESWNIQAAEALDDYLAFLSLESSHYGPETLRVIRGARGRSTKIEPPIHHK